VDHGKLGMGWWFARAIPGYASLYLFKFLAEASEEGWPTILESQCDAYTIVHLALK